MSCWQSVKISYIKIEPNMMFVSGVGKFKVFFTKVSECMPKIQSNLGIIF